MRGIFSGSDDKSRVVAGNSSLGVLIEDGQAKGGGEKMMCFLRENVLLDIDMA